MGDEFMDWTETLERETDVPEWALEASWMLGVCRSEDRLWQYLGLFLDPKTRPVICPCQPEPDEPLATVRLAPLAMLAEGVDAEVLLVGQCYGCEQVYWGQVV